MTYPSNAAFGQDARRSSRRGFFKIAGGGLAGATALSVVGCDSGDPREEADVTLDFSDDFGVLNYAYALEQLEAAFYIQAVTAIDDGSLDLGTEAANVYFREVAAHEVVHRDFLATAIPALEGTLIRNLTPDFSSVDFTSSSSVLTTARLLEDTGVSAYNGAGIYLTDPGLLTIAGKIVSVEARHAASIRSLIAGLGTQDFADIASIGELTGAQVSVENALDAANPNPNAVLSAAGGFIQERIEAINIPG